MSSRRPVDVNSEKNIVEVTQEFNTIDVYTTVGAKGKSAYDLWIDSGNSVSVHDFLESLVGGNHTHNQMVPSDNWVIEHGLGFFPNVTTFSSADEQVFGDITHININKLQIQFSGALSGKAHLS